MRAMDFGCGTGLLTQKILDPDVFSEIVGVDVAEGMIGAFKSKLSMGVIDTEKVKVSAILQDLVEVNVEHGGSKQ